MSPIKELLGKRANKGEIVMKFIRVNMTDKAVKVEDIPKPYQGLGGRCLTSCLIDAEVQARCDALGPENKLVFV